MIQGVSGDRQVVLVNDIVNNTAIGAKLATGRRLWELPRTECSSAPLDGVATCLRPSSQGSDLVRLDLASGQATTFYSAPFAVDEVTPVGVFGGNQIVIGESGLTSTILSFGPTGDIIWQVTHPGTTVTCHLLTDHLGCESDRGEAFSVLRAIDGTVVRELTPLNRSTPELVNWFTDGYMIQRGFFDGEVRPYLRWDGSVVEAKANRGPSTPNNHQRFFYPIADALDGVGPSAVDATGRAVTTYPGFGRGQVFQPSGTQQAAAATPHAVSASGDVVLAEASDTTLGFFDRSGKEIYRLDTSVSRAEIIDGIIVDHALRGPTVVFAPRG